MPIAAVVPTLFAAGATIYSANKASKANDKALAAQEGAANRAEALQQQNYNDMAPWRSYGLGALQQLAQVNGITLPASVINQAQPVDSSRSAASAYLTSNPDVAAEYNRLSPNNLKNNYGITSPEEFAAWHYQNYGKSEGRAYGDTPTATPQPTTAAGTPANNPTAASADPRLAGFFASPDYGFRVQEGTGAITGNAASRGLLDSGATGKALINYGQQAGSAEFGNWYNRLAEAAGVGQQATVQSAQANTNQGNIATNQAQNQASSYQRKADISSGLVGDLVGLGNGLLQNYGAGANQSAAGRYVPTTNNTVSTPGMITGQTPGVFNDPSIRTLFSSVI